MCTIANAFKIFMEYKKSYCDESTCKYYEQNLGFYFDYLEMHYNLSVELLRLDDLDKKVVQNYISYLRNKTKFENHPFKIDSHKMGNLKNSTIRIYVRAVRVFMNYCLNEDLTVVNFSKKIKLPKDDTKMQVPLFKYEVEQIDNLFNYSTVSGLRNLCMIHLLLDAGLRAEELIALRVCDVNFQKNIITVLDSKNHKSRIVPLCWMLKNNLQAYLEVMPGCPEAALFVKHGNQEPINYNVLKQLFSRIRKKTGIDRLHPHLLRHTFAISYLVYGGNLEFLRDMLGHTDYAVTKNYVRLANQYRIMDADIYKLDDIFFLHKN